MGLNLCVRRYLLQSWGVAAVWLRQISRNPSTWTLSYLSQSACLRLTRRALSTLGTNSMMYPPTESAFQKDEHGHVNMAFPSHHTFLAVLALEE